MKCPKCVSEDCQRLEVVFEGGTQNINTTSRTSGAGITGGASMGGALAHTKTTGTSQSTLAQKASPPQKQKLGVFIVMIIVGFFMLSTPLSTLYNSLILKGLKFNNFLAKNCKPSIYRALEKRVESQVRQCQNIGKNFILSAYYTGFLRLIVKHYKLIH